MHAVVHSGGPAVIPTWVWGSAARAGTGCGSRESPGRRVQPGRHTRAHLGLGSQVHAILADLVAAGSLLVVLQPLGQALLRQALRPRGMVLGKQLLSAGQVLADAQEEAEEERGQGGLVHAQLPACMRGLSAGVGSRWWRGAQAAVLAHPTWREAALCSAP